MNAIAPSSRRERRQQTETLTYPRGPWFRFAQAHIHRLCARSQERGQASPRVLLAEILDRAIARDCEAAT